MENRVCIRGHAVEIEVFSYSSEAQTFVGTPAIELESIKKRFGQKEALKGISVSLPTGIICGVIGPNGSGKTTTLRIILDILQPDEGKVSVLGSEASRLANDRISYLPEERGLYKKMKISHQLQYFGGLKNVSKRDIKTRSKAWLERLNLGDVSEQRVETLSKGMAQKIQFIGAIINEPELLILDEPFSGLDPVNMEILREAIVEMKNNGTTILFSTHDMGMAEKMCDSILMIYEGNKVLDGSLEQIQERYDDDTIRVKIRPRRGDARSSGAILSDCAGVGKIRDFGRYQEVSGVENRDDFLGMLTQAASVDYFEITPPNLHDIFVRIARPSEQEARETQGTSVS